MSLSPKIVANSCETPAEISKKSEPLVSVIIPVYNVVEFLDECISSVCSQTYENLEIILSNDGSTDGSSSLCRQWAKKDSRIRLINEHNGGLSAARNRGLKLATGEFVTFVDSDDWISPNLVGDLIELSNLNKSDLVISGFSWVKPGSGAVNAQKDGQHIPTMSPDEAFCYLGKKAYFDVSAWGKLIRTEVAKQVLFDESIHQWEDVPFSYQIIKLSNIITYDSLPRYFYRVRTGTLSRTRASKSFISEANYRKLFFSKEFNGSIHSRKLQQIRRLNFIARSNRTLVLDSDSSVEEFNAFVKREIRNGLITVLFSQAELSTIQKIIVLITAISPKRARNISNMFNVKRNAS